MAIYHLSAEPIQRSKGHSAVAAAAYRAAERLYDERLVQAQDYTRKSGVVQSHIVAPDNAPVWVQDREALWNQAELAEKRRDAQPAREIRLALPDELTDEQRADLVFAFSQDAFVSRGMVADISIHRPARYGDERNHHAHILLTMRELDGDQFARTKQRDWNRTELLEEWREQWEMYQNRALEDAGSDARVDHRTLEAQGIDREPTIHLGKATTTVERRGEQNERGDRNREIVQRNQEYDELVAGRAALDTEIAFVEGKKQLQNPANSDVARAFEDPVAAYEPENSFAFLADREPAPDVQPALSWEEEKKRLQNPANMDVTNLFEELIAEYALESRTASFADREPAPNEQPALSWEKQKLQAQDPFVSEIAKEAERQVRQYGEIKEYGLGKNWFERTVIYAENMYHDAAQTMKDTWEKLVRKKDDPDRDDPGFRR